MMGSSPARARLRAVLEQFITEPVELDAVFDGAPILETVSISSIVLVHLVAALEREYAVRFDEASMDRAFLDVGSLLAFLSGRSGGDTG